MLEDSRFKRANFEALCSLILTFAYFAWWYFSAYGPSSFYPIKSGLIFGFPKWFFLSCVAGPLLFCFLSWAMVALFFKDMPITSEGRRHV